MKDKNDTLGSLNMITIDSDPAVLAKIFGSRFNRAWELLKNRKIIKYVFQPSARIRWIVEGKKREYLILPNTKYCDCDDFIFGIVYGKALACQHLIAHRIAVVLNDYEIKAVEDSQFDFFTKRWRRIELQTDPAPSESIVRAVVEDCIIDGMKKTISGARAHPVKSLDIDWNEGSLIRGVLFYRDLSPTSCNWMFQLFHDAYDFLSKQRLTDKDYYDIPLNPLQVCNHFRKISEFLPMSSSSNLEVWSHF